MTLSVLLKSIIFKSKDVTNEKLYIKDEEWCDLILQLPLLQISLKQNCMSEGREY